MQLTLPTDSKVRKNYPLYSGLFGYFPAALAGVARHSAINNEKHNPGQPMHWSMDKSDDHAECVARHLVDTQEMAERLRRRPAQKPQAVEQLLYEVNALVWRACALSQTLHMEFGDAPLPSHAYRGDDKPGQSPAYATVTIEPYISDLDSVETESPSDGVTESPRFAAPTDEDILAAAEIERIGDRIFNENLDFIDGCGCTQCKNTALVAKVRAYNESLR